MGRGGPRAANFPLPEQHVVGVLAGLAWETVARGGRLRGSQRRGGAVTAAGAVGLAAGLALVLAAWRAAGDERLEDPHAVVTAGPYARMRNPMYVGWVVMHLGLGVVLRSPAVLATVAPAVVLVHREVLQEERRLERSLGSPYSRYLATVPRYGVGTALGRGPARTGWRTTTARAGTDQTGGGQATS